VDKPAVNSLREGESVMIRVHSVGKIVKEIYRTYIVDHPTHFAASLAYYSLFSLVPIIYIAFRFAGVFIDDEAATQRMFTEVERVLGADVAELLMLTLEAISHRPASHTIVDRIVSSFAMLFGASLLFFRLQHTLNTIWKIPSSSEGQTKNFLLNHMLAFVMVFCIGILVVVIALAQVLVSFFDSLLQIQLSTPFLALGGNLAIGTASIALLFKLLPSARISWKDAVIGATATALLLTVGANGLGWYLAKGNVGSAFEAAGTLAIVLIAIYFQAQFFIFGAVFTRVFAETYGSGIHPRDRLS
jgi:membrane protein